MRRSTDCTKMRRPSLEQRRCGAGRSGRRSAVERAATCPPSPRSLTNPTTSGSTRLDGRSKPSKSGDVARPVRLLSGGHALLWLERETGVVCSHQVICTHSQMQAFDARLRMSPVARQRLRLHGSGRSQYRLLFGQSDSIRCYCSVSVQIRQPHIIAWAWGEWILSCGQLEIRACRYSASRQRPEVFSTYSSPPQFLRLPARGTGALPEHA
mmetsp:Transcript_48290/g.140833  ORF Transcript_48290/g.140833 Transcript_48290/m.140833 type:complete len:211 (-) Transcript_48290:163-795(-)